MIRIALMIIAAVGSTVLVSDVVDEAKATPRAAESRLEASVNRVEAVESTDLDGIGSALRFVGICSVVCSLIGGTVLITISRRKGVARCNG